MNKRDETTPPTKLKSAVMGEQSTKKTMTEEQRKARNEQKKHQRINEKYCHTILMKDWETFEELLPYGNTKPTNGNNILVVCNKQGTKFFKHTIKTEPISQEEAESITDTSYD